jgi:hypothetical protein
MTNRIAQTSCSGFRCMAQLLWIVLGGVFRRCYSNEPKSQRRSEGPSLSTSRDEVGVGLLLGRHAGAEQQIKRIKRRTSCVPTG